MTAPMSTNLIDVPASIVLTFAASPLPPLKPLWWPWGLAATAVLGLLVGFYVVVREVEQQGESRRLAVATHEEATWRCQALLGRLPRASCLVQLNAPRDKLPVVQLVAGSNQR